MALRKIRIKDINFILAVNWFIYLPKYFSWDQIVLRIVGDVTCFEFRNWFPNIADSMKVKEKSPPGSMFGWKENFLNRFFLAHFNWISWFSWSSFLFVVTWWFMCISSLLQSIWAPRNKKKSSKKHISLWSNVCCFTIEWNGSRRLQRKSTQRFCNTRSHWLKLSVYSIYNGSKHLTLKTIQFKSLRRAQFILNWNFA